MKLFKKSTISLALTAAVAGGALMGLSAPVQAVNIAQDGLGEVLVFPYYNTRDGWTSLFTVTNTSNKTVIAKVRWREAKNSRDVRDFNVVLSPYDVWTAGTRSAGEGAEMFTTDNSCTFPQLPSISNIGGNEVTGIAFTNAAYAQAGGEDNRDNGGTSLDRTKEGYFEVIEMGTISNASSVGNNAEQLAFNAEHTGGGNNTAVPESCDNVRALLRGNVGLTTAQLLEEPENNLKGEAVLVKGADGIAAGYNPTTLANFADTQIYDEPDSPNPNLDSASPAAAVIISDANPTAPTTFIPASGRGVDAVSELISRSTVINNFNVAGDSQTSWVMTFPTKNFYVDRPLFGSNGQSPLGAGVTPLAPFDGAVNGHVFGLNQVDPAGNSCFDVNFSLWDREEYQPTATVNDGFSPRIGAATNQTVLCYEANIVSFGGSGSVAVDEPVGLFSSKVAGQISDSVLPGENGWGMMSFGSGAALPVVGMKVEIRNRGDASVNYGFANDHAYKRATGSIINN